MLDYEDNLNQLSRPKEWYLKQTELSPLIQSWPVPSKVEIEGKSLIYDITKYGPRIEPNQATMRRGLLGGFLDLAEADDQAILEYARKWGVLGLCKHGLPAAHISKPHQKPTWFVLEEPGCVIKREGNWLYESLDRWRHYARQFRSIIALAVELSKEQPRSKEEFMATLRAMHKAFEAEREGRPYNKELIKLKFEFIAPRTANENRRSVIPTVIVAPEVPGRQEDWQIVLQDYWDGSQGNYSPDPIICGRVQLTGVINGLLRLSGIYPSFGWSYETKFVLESRAARGFIFPRLAIQLMLLINGSPDYALCSGCGKSILLRKGQSIHRKSYCKDCGLNAARREAVKKYYKQERTNPERNKRKRLRLKDVVSIQRALKKSKPGLVKELAQKYGVSEWAIYKIREGKTWKEAK